MTPTFLPVVLIALLGLGAVLANPYPQAALPDRIFNHQNESSSQESEEPSINNQTIADLVQQQTDTVKQIVIDQHEQQTRFDYPSIAKPIDPDYEKEKIREDLDKLSVEELKLKCQHLTRLINGNNRADPPVSESNQNKLSYSKVKFGNRRPISGFYITQRGTSSTSTTPKVPQSEPPTTAKPLQNIKYIKLEPVILQKTILSDGRTIYYWHKSLPSTVQLNSQPLPSASQIIPSSSSSSSSSTSTTSTTPASSGYDFRNFFPSFYSLGGSEPIGEVTTEKTTTAPPAPTTTTPFPPTIDSITTEKQENLLYAQQLRFVVPVPYANVDNLGVKQPWDFDQFAYYPKQLQPQTVNVQMPYVPTFHIIKALAVPNKPEEPNKSDDYTAFDNVNV